MEPRKVGRTLGIGVRVASNMLRERVEQARQAAPPVAAPSPDTASSAPPASPIGTPRPPSSSRASSVSGRPAGADVTNKVANAKRGVRAFGQALLTPFTHAGGILWLEITGLFFALFAFFFAQSVYRLRGVWNQPGQQSHLLLYAVLAIGFGWFSVSSFVRARRKTKRGPAWKN
jgi:hypothetical protein